MINPFLFLFRARDKPRSAVIQPITAFQKRSFRETKPWKITKKEQELLPELWLPR